MLGFVSLSHRVFKKTFFLTLVLSLAGLGSTQKDSQPIGAHYEVFRLEKNENPQNVLVVYTRLDPGCRFLLEKSEATKPVFDFYWLMNHKTYKPVHPLIKDGIQRRLVVFADSDFPQKRHSFSVQLSELRDIAPSLQNSMVHVSASKNGKNCELKAVFDVAQDAPAGEKARSLQVDKIYLESEKTFLPPFRKVVSLRIEGRNEKTGIVDQKIFTGKNN